MADEAETPAQRQARIRQQKREAKIKANAQERLDKITSLGGRPREPVQSTSPAQTPPVSASPTPGRIGADATHTPPMASMLGQTNDPNQMRMQEEYVRALLEGGPQNQSGQGQQGAMPDDPMMQMMQAMMGGMGGDPNAPASEGGIGGFPVNADDISRITGIPSFVTSMFLGGKQQAPPTPEQVKSERTWKIVRMIVSLFIGLYTVFTLNKSIETFGHNPPAPATAQNPFVVFLMGELLFNGAKTVLSGRPVSQGRPRSWIQTGREIGRDGAVMVFVVGVYSWWKGYT